jgi:hypothetical protein
MEVILVNAAGCNVCHTKQEKARLLANLLPEALISRSLMALPCPPILLPTMKLVSANGLKRLS